MVFRGLGVVAIFAVMSSGASVVLAKSVVQAAPTDLMFASHQPLMATTLAAPSQPSSIDDSTARATEDTSSNRTPTLAAAKTLPVLVELAMQPADGRISQAIRRYAEAHGWQLAWEIERDFPIEYPATFTGDFLGVIEQVVLSLQNSDAPIRVKVYEANRVLRVVHATQ